MRILFLAHRIPYPPDKGDKIRSYQVLRYLAERHEVHLACLVDSERDLQSAEDVRTIVKKLVYEPLPRLRQKLSMTKSFVSGKPMTVHYFYSQSLQDKLKALVQENHYDALFVYSSNMAEYVQDLDIPVKIIDYCDLDSQKFKQYAEMRHTPRSWLYRFESNRLADYETKAAEHFDHILFIGQEEKRWFNCNGAAHKVKLMSNGVDFTRYFGHELPENGAAQNNGKPYLLFTGAMDYVPNIDAAQWFAKDIFPMIKNIMPELAYYIVGGNPARKVKKLHDPEVGIHVTGYVDDIVSYVKNARVFVAPMRIARGMQTKILEAIACGVPVVTSPQAAKGIGAWPGREVLVAKTPGEYARQILSLLLNDKSRTALRKRAFKFLLNKFQWDENLLVLDGLLGVNSKSQAPNFKLTK